MGLFVIDNGGREHALAWKLVQSSKVETVFAAPGNAGTAIELKLQNITLTAHQDLIDFCRSENIAFTIVDPEAPLAAGVMNDFRAAGSKIFSPTQYTAQLESPKDFARAFMAKYNIPATQYQTFGSVNVTYDCVNRKGAPIVIKADGLAADKGVIVAMTLDEVYAAIDNVLLGDKMGNAGAHVVIEDFLQSEETSFIVMVDGNHVLPMATSQNHKHLLDDNRGPNTGGMNAYSPAPVATPGVYERAVNEIISPTVADMRTEGHEFTGFLYAGLMIDRTDAPYTIEFSYRFGDPETQPTMSRLDNDLVDLVETAIDDKLDSIAAEWDPQAAMGMVLAAQNYPDSPRKGDVIFGLDKANKIGKVFHAGTATNKKGGVITNGNRALCVVGLGDNVAQARSKAYEALETICLNGMQYREDIADKAINRQ